MQKNNGKITIAVAKPGNRGFEESVRFLQAAKIFCEPQKEGIVKTSNPRIEVAFVSPLGIPQYVRAKYELGITGIDMAEECGDRDGLILLLKLNEQKARVSIALRNDAPEGLAWLDGRIVGTKMPNIAEKFLAGEGVNARIVNLGGTFEQGCVDEMVDAIVDQVSTGRTLKKYGMREEAKILDTELCLFGNAEAYERKKAFIKPIVTAMRGAVEGKAQNLLVFNVPPDAAYGIDRLIYAGRIPCGESPSVSPLKEKGAFAYSVLVPDSRYLEVIQMLSDYGARDILDQKTGLWVKGETRPGSITMEGLYSTILDRVQNPKPESTTNRLLESPGALLGKLKDEVAEFMWTVQDDQGPYRIKSEASDVLYPSLVMAAGMGKTMQDVLYWPQFISKGWSMDIERFKSGYTELVDGFMREGNAPDVAFGNFFSGFVGYAQGLGYRMDDIAR